MKGLGLVILAALLVAGSTKLYAENSPLGVFQPTTNQAPTGLQIVTAWNPSPDPNVVGYYVGWGLASGHCTNLINVGNVTNATLSGLSTNVLYFFTVVAYDAFNQQAPPSNEIQYIGTNTAVVTPPTILTDLTNQNAVAGANVELAVMASGSDPLGYLWLFDGLPLQVSSSDTLTLTGLTVQQQGQYQVIITNSAGAVTSSVATVTVILPPAITSDLASQTVRVGSNVTLQVGVSGTRPLGCRWFWNGAALSGATGDYLTLNNVSQGQSGTYQLVVTNAAGSASSSLATLTVLDPPKIVTDLADRNVAVGSNVTFAVSVAGSPPLTFQWQFNGTPLSGATSSALVLDNVNLSKSGTYQVIVSNAVGTASSVAAHLSVLLPPVITAAPTNLIVTPGSSALFQAELTGSAPMTYQWIFNSTNLAGANTNPLVLQNVDSSQAGKYQLVVSNAVGAAISAPASLTVASPPVIVNDLTNELAAAGSGAALSLGVSGSGPFAYQWIFNETNLLSQNTAELTLTNLTPSQQGTYYAIVSNSYGSATSSVAFLSVAASPVILENLTNITAISGSTVTLAVVAAGTGPLSYQWLYNGSTLLVTSNNTLTLNNISAGAAGTYRVSVSNAAGSVLSDPAVVTVVTPPTIGIDLTNQTVISGSSVVFQVQASGTGPLSYQWLWNGVVVPGATSNSLALASVTTQQAGSYQVLVQNAFGQAQSTVASLSVITPNLVRIDRVNSDQLQITFAGVAGQNYTMQYSTNFTANWINSGSATADATGTVVFLASPSAPSTLYRIAPKTPPGHQHP